MNTRMSGYPMYDSWKEFGAPNHPNPKGRVFAYTMGMAGYLLALPVRVGIVAYYAIRVIKSFLTALVSLIAGERIKQWKDFGKQLLFLAVSVAEVGTGAIGVLCPWFSWKAEHLIYQNELLQEKLIFSKVEVQNRPQQTVRPSVPTPLRRMDPADTGAPYVPPLDRPPPLDPNPPAIEPLSAEALTHAFLGSDDDPFVNACVGRAIDYVLTVKSEQRGAIFEALYSSNYSQNRVRVSLEKLFLLQFLLDRRSQERADEIGYFTAQLATSLEDPLKPQFDELATLPDENIVNFCINTWISPSAYPIWRNPPLLSLTDEIDKFHAERIRTQEKALAFAKFWHAGIVQWCRAKSVPEPLPLPQTV